MKFEELKICHYNLFMFKLYTTKMSQASGLIIKSKFTDTLFLGQLTTYKNKNSL